MCSCLVVSHPWRSAPCFHLNGHAMRVSLPRLWLCPVCAVYSYINVFVCIFWHRKFAIFSAFISATTSMCMSLSLRQCENLWFCLLLTTFIFLTLVCFIFSFCFRKLSCRVYFFLLTLSLFSFRSTK